MSKTSLLCIIPISTTGMTDELRRMHPSTKNLDISFIDGSGLEKCPPCIENNEQAIESANAILPRAISAMKSHLFDGILVCCFSDHPLVYELRQNCVIPVLGIFEAAIEDATSSAGRFGIVTTARSWETILMQSVRDLHYDQRCAGIRATGLSVLDLAALPRNEVIETIKASIDLLRESGATSIILGCAGMAGMENSIGALLPSEIRLIDGVRSGLNCLKGSIQGPTCLREERL